MCVCCAMWRRTKRRERVCSTRDRCAGRAEQIACSRRVGGAPIGSRERGRHRSGRRGAGDEVLRERLVMRRETLLSGALLPAEASAVGIISHVKLRKGENLERHAAATGEQLCDGGAVRCARLAARRPLGRGAVRVAQESRRAAIGRSESIHAHCSAHAHSGRARRRLVQGRCQLSRL
jgi:hypothetical protein